MKNQQKSQYCGLLFLILTIFSCSAQESELLDFQYQGYSDTIYALIQGEVYEKDGLMKKALVGVQVISDKPCPKDSVTLSGENGSFQKGFCKGVYTIFIKKKGYQTIKLINYESTPDQVSILRALLRKGQGEVVYDISKKQRGE